jgi:hypothetical protein
MTTLEGDNVYGYNKDNWLISAVYPDSAPIVMVEVVAPSRGACAARYLQYPRRLRIWR